MPATRPPIPAEWTANSSTRASSEHGDSSEVHITFDEESQQHHERHGSNLPNPYVHDETGHGEQDLRRRRSSMGLRIDALRHAGGVNSLNNFARSWQRAAAFIEVVPVRRSFIYEGDDNEDPSQADAGKPSEELTPGQHRSMLRAAFEAQGGSSEDAVEEDAGSIHPRKPSHTIRDSLSREQQPLLSRKRLPSQTHDDNIFHIEPSLASAFGGSYGSTWGSLATNVNEPSMRHAGRLFRQQQAQEPPDLTKEAEPVIVKQIEDSDGKVINVIVGQSTLPQTVFNSVNVLIGIGLLALPLALRLSGWIPGLIFFIFAGATTCYTAKLLAKCADVDNSLITFADLAYVSFGPWARLATSLLFSLELIAACVALVVLFADSLDALIPGWGLTEWKVVCGIVLLPLAFVPLRYLSYTSILGILCCFGITAAIIIDGLIKPHTPGSLREPAQTYLFPKNWMTLLIAFGILMSPWGGHSVFPNIYRDMRHPYKYHRAVNITYSFTFILDLMMAVIGVIMFGDDVKDEITRNILESMGFPESLNYFIVVCVAIIPLTKVPLNARPIISTLEQLLGLDSRAIADVDVATGLSSLTRGVLKITVKVVCIVSFVVLAILIPQFDTIMSLLGAVACFTICLILPCAFHLKLFGSELSKSQKALDWTLIIVSSVLAVVSTAFNFIPIER